MITNLEIKNAQPKDKEYSICVGEGLYINIKPTGSKLWRFRYSFSKKRNMISLGKYPQVSLKEAKVKQQKFIELLDQGINPSTYKQIQKIKQATEKTFKEVALEWHLKKYDKGNERHSRLILQRMEKYLFPLIGRIPIKSLEAPILYNIVESIQETYIETGKRVNSYCSLIFRFGVAKGYCTRDLTQDYRGMLKTAKTKHMPTITDPEKIGELFRDMDDYDGKIITKTALEISPYVFLRPSELARSKWDFIDFEKSQWIIPAEIMKMRRDHLIPFPHQVKTLLEKLYPVTCNSEYIFPNERDISKHLNTETVNIILKRINDGKYKGVMVSHGFRSMASTILNEHGFKTDIIEKQLAHQERNKIRGAYNRAEYLEERIEMMHWYADHLDTLRLKN